MADERQDVRAFTAAALTCAWLALLECFVTSIRHGLGIADLLWLFATTASLTTLLVLPLSVVVLGMGRVRFLMRAIRWVQSHGYARWPLTALLLSASALTHWINATRYVRLYLLIHLLLTAMTLLAAMLGFALAIGLRTRQRRELKRRQVLAIAGGLAAWLTLLASCLWITVDSFRLRSLAIENTTLLSHELILLDQISGILTPTELGDSSQVPPELLAALRAQPLVASQGEKHNIVMLTVDSLRADRMLATGAAHPMLPHLEALSENASVFTRAYSPSCWTIHAMSATLTSQLPSQLDFAHVSVSADLKFTVRSEAKLIENPLQRKAVTPVPILDVHTTLAKLLGSAGYRTSTVVPYVFYLRDAGVTRDFQFVDEESYRQERIDGSGITKTPLVDRALASLDTHTGPDPFFLWLHFMEGHAPYEAQDERAVGGSAVARYDSELRFVDAEIGRLLAALRERKLLENSIVVVHADHGEEFQDHGGTFHATTLYEETIHVPLIIKTPGASVGQSIHAPVSLIDLAPTLLDLVGVASADPLMGRSLRPLLEGRPVASRPVLAECFRFGRRKRSVTIWPYKLILDESVGTVQLFNLQSDPKERDNIADAQEEVTAGLLSLLTALREQP